MSRIAPRRSFNSDCGSDPMVKTVYRHSPLGVHEVDMLSRWLAVSIRCTSKVSIGSAATEGLTPHFRLVSTLLYREGAVGNPIGGRPGGRSEERPLGRSWIPPLVTAKE